MSSKRLKRVGLTKETIERLTKNNILTCKDLLSRTNLELLKLLGFGFFSVQNVINTCCQACAPQPITGLELLRSRQRNFASFFSTSLPDLDNVLHGGLPVGTISEIAGPSGCGKTQFCMMLSVLGALPSALGGLEGAVIYIDTEAAFSAERLIEIAQKKFPAHYNSEDRLIQLSSQVLVDSQQTCSSLIKRLQSLEDDIITHRVKLVILDSVASLVRKEYSSSLGRNLTIRTNFLAQQAAILKYLAEVFSIPVVVTNQITTRFDQPESAASFDFEGDLTSAETDGGYVTAALGNTWSHSVNTRLILQYLHGNSRQVLVAKSPVAPFTSFTYTIEAGGIVQQDGGAGHYEGTDPGTQRIQVRTALPASFATVHF